MGGAEAVRELRLAAIQRLVGHDVGSDRLIELALGALLAGVESESLPLLAGLNRAEEPDAGELFDHVIGELRLLPSELPAEHVARTGALVWWWAQLIVDAELDMRSGAELIYWHGGGLLDTHDHGPLSSLIGAIVHFDDELSSQAVWDTDRHRRRRAAAVEVIDRARELLAQPPPWRGSAAVP
jgi:hypothetical protein